MIRGRGAARCGFILCTHLDALSGCCGLAGVARQHMWACVYICCCLASRGATWPRFVHASPCNFLKLQLGWCGPAAGTGCGCFPARVSRLRGALQNLPQTTTGRGTTHHSHSLCSVPTCAPVGATASSSRCSSKAGTACRWMGVGVCQPFSVRCARSFCGISR